MFRVLRRTNWISRAFRIIYTNITKLIPHLSRVTETLSLCRRVANVIRKCYNCSAEDIRTASQVLKYGLRERKMSELNVVPRTLAAVDFNKFPICCAYMITFAACHVELTYLAMKCLFHVQDGWTKASVTADTLAVASIGGGPGNDLLGAMYMLEERCPRLQSLKLHIVDAEIRWQVFFSTMMSEIGSNGKCNKLCRFTSRIDLHHSFLHCDVTDLMGERFNQAREVLRSADLVLMVKTLSMLTLEKKLSLVKAVLYLMKGGSVLLIVDTEWPLLIALYTQGSFEVLMDVKDIVACTKSSTVYNCDNIDVCVADAVALKKK